ncbi:MAG: FtsQ-type POTRA domain-containing protein [Ruminococcaceae bacterium]|nr:FtsQ-type POTRA domain-containing protein [Oscillospiraceae bacterium]
MQFSLFQGAKRRKRLKNALYIPVIFLVLVAAMVFAMSIFFRVARIEVIGNQKYAANDVIIASGLEEGENLVFINRFAAVSRLFSRLPYVEKASVVRKLPNKVVIEISECVSIAYVTLDSQPWIIDRNCKVLAQAKPADMESLIRIDGISPINPTVGEKMKVSAEDTDKVPYISEILDQIQKREIQKDFSSINIADNSAPTMSYLSRFFVKLGPLDNTEQKFGKMLSAVSKLKSGDTGTLDLSLDSNKVVFSPE